MFIKAMTFKIRYSSAMTRIPKNRFLNEAQDVTI
jgi:hypothetical protein